MKKKRKIVGIIAIAFIALAILGSANKDKAYKGVSLSPGEFSEEGFIDFLEKTKETGNMVTWAGDWLEISTGEGPVILTELAKKYKYTPLVAVGHYIQNTGELIRPFDESTRKIYKKSTIDFVTKNKPKFFAMGVEVNVLKNKNPENYAGLVEFYNEMYDAIKEASPKTQVFTAHQLETMKGYQFWATSEPS